MKFKAILRKVGPVSLGLTLPSSFPTILPWVKSGADVDLVVSVDEDGESYIKISPAKNIMESNTFSNKMRKVVEKSVGDGESENVSEE